MAPISEVGGAVQKLVMWARDLRLCDQSPPHDGANRAHNSPRAKKGAHAGKGSQMALARGSGPGVPVASAHPALFSLDSIYAIYDSSLRLS